MKTWFVRWGVLWLSLFSTLYYCSKGILAAFLGISSRSRVDGYIQSWAKSVLKLIRLDYQVFNPHQVTFLPDRPYVVMCNHSSMYDIPISIVAIPGSLRMMAKKELSRLPIFGLALKKTGFLFIDRKNTQNAIQDLRLAAESMRTGIIIWISPEGTRSHNGQLLPFKKGGFMLALQTGATIVPMGIRGAKDIVENKTLKIRLHQKAEVHIGKPIDVKEYGLERRAELMAAVRQAIQEAAGLES